MPLSVTSPGCGHQDVTKLCLQRIHSPRPTDLCSRRQQHHRFLDTLNWCTNTQAYLIKGDFVSAGSARGMTSDMLKFLTQKLKSQTLNEVQQYQLEDVDDEERDSGTESDENLDEEFPYGSKSSLQDASLLISSNNTEGGSHTRDDGRTNDSLDSSGAKTHEISEHNFDTISCTSDYERHSLDFDRHSSEDELVTINKENVAEKRKWSQVHHRSGYCDSAGSSDDEVREFLFNPQPVLLSSSPPKGVQKVYTHVPSPRLVLARMAPLTVSSVSPRKRHRQNTTSDNFCDTESGSLTRRPCLDFEKMQQLLLALNIDERSTMKGSIVC